MAEAEVKLLKRRSVIEPLQQQLQAKLIMENAQAGMFTVLVFSTQQYFKTLFEEVEVEGLQFKFTTDRLCLETLEACEEDFQAVCIFVNDTCSKEVLEKLSERGVHLVLLRCAGFNNVDLDAAKKLEIDIKRVPCYSPSSVAEHAVALTFMLCRNLHKADERVQNGNFLLSGLEGREISSMTVGVVGAGNIGNIYAKSMHALGAKVMYSNLTPVDELAHLHYVSCDKMDEIFTQCDIISLHVPLLKPTAGMINKDSIAKMKKGVLIVNTSRGGLIVTNDLIEALESGQVGGAALDVVEGEKEVYFRDHGSVDAIPSEHIKKLVKMQRKCILTGHQAFLTKEALGNIVDTTVDNAVNWIKNHQTDRQLTVNSVSRVYR